MTWTDYFKSHAEFQKVPVKYWSPNGKLERIYFEDGSYLQRKMTFTERENSGYYSTHRAAKGDTLECSSDSVTWSGTVKRLEELLSLSESTKENMREFWFRCLALLDQKKGKK